MSNNTEDDCDIVVIDDDVLEHTVMTRALRGTEYKIVCFQNIEDAMAFLMTHSPAILFVDYRMHEIDGIGFIKQLTTQRDISNTMIYLTSSSPVQADIAIEAHELGAQFIEKDVLSTAHSLEKLCITAIQQQTENLTWTPLKN